MDNDNNGVADDADANGFEDRWDPGDTFLDDTPTTAPLAPLNKAGFANVALWGGLVILGRAPTNLADKCGVGYGKCVIEGCTVPGFPAADCDLRRRSSRTTTRACSASCRFATRATRSATATS